MLDRSPLLQKLGIDGTISRLDEAMTHSSFANEHPEAADYERLEFLGDAVLALCVTELLLQHAPTANEGTLTRTRASLVNTHALAEFARSINLGRWINSGKGAGSSGDAFQSKVLADVVEAIVAAIYLDRGLEGARAVTEKIVGDSLLAMARISRRDPKSELQERVQRTGCHTPTYRVVSEHGPQNKIWFQVEVSDGTTVLGQGEGRSKKSAEQAAAQAALLTLSSPNNSP